MDLMDAVGIRKRPSIVVLMEDQSLYETLSGEDSIHRRTAKRGSWNPGTALRGRL